MEEANIHFTRARTTQDGIKIYTQQSRDYNKLRVGRNFIPISCYKRKKNHVLIRGLYGGMDTKQVQMKLRKKNIPADVSPMRTKLPLPLYAVKTERVEI